MLDIIKRFYSDNLFVKEKKNFYYLSIFDKWLSEEECLNQVMSFVEVKNDKNKYIEYKIFENRIIGFIFDLYNKYTLNIYDLGLKRKQNFNSTDNLKKSKINDFIDIEIKLIYALREKIEIIICIEELECIIFSNYDLTLPIYIKQNFLNNIKDTAKQNNIFLLK